MKLAIASDLHFEHHHDEIQIVSMLSDAKADVIVLAGDITSGEKREATLTLMSLIGPPVVYVPGNHEHYGGQVPGYKPAVVQHGDQRFVTATLWTERADDGPLNDHRCIIGYDGARWHREDLAFLREHVQPGDVVVTHHAPSFRSVHPRFADSRCNDLFATDLEEFMREREPRLWIHGHMHDPVDYMVGQTRVVSNPRGYPGRESAGWKVRVVEV